MTATLGLKSAYEHNHIVRDACKKLMAIALMPIDDVEDSYEEVLKDISQEKFPDLRILNAMNELMNYYNQGWLGVVGKEMYCVYNLDWRTNNNCEGLYS
jgi:hypothetical protein